MISTQLTGEPQFVAAEPAASSVPVPSLLVASARRRL